MNCTNIKRSTKSELPGESIYLGKIKIERQALEIILHLAQLLPSNAFKH